MRVCVCARARGGGAWWGWGLRGHSSPLLYRQGRRWVAGVCEGARSGLRERALWAYGGAWGPWGWGEVGRSRATATLTRFPHLWSSLFSHLLKQPAGVKGVGGGGILVSFGISSPAAHLLHVRSKGGERVCQHLRECLILTCNSYA